MKRKNKVLLLLCSIFLLAFFVGCSKKSDDTALTSKNSSTRTFDEYTVTMYNKYEKTSRTEFYGYDVYTTKDEKTLVIIWQADAACTIHGYANQWKTILEESGYGQTLDFKEEECTIEDKTFCNLQWTGSYDGKDVVMDSMHYITEGKMFMIWMIGESDNAQNLHQELETMAGTLKYTGPRHLPIASDYPFTVTAGSISMTMQEGMYATDIKEMHTGQSEYILESDRLNIELYGLDDQDASIITKCVIEKAEQDKSAEEQAKEYYESKVKGNTFDSITADQFFMEEVWPGIDDSFKGIIVFRTSLTDEKVGMVIDIFYFEYNGEVYSIKVGYVNYMPETKDAIYNAVNGLKLL